jgi:hypothetical protein
MRTSTAFHILSAGILASFLTTTAACASPRGRMYVRSAPPAPLVEVRAVVPRPGYVWVDGYYRWNGRGYVWMPGRWTAPPRARAVWVPGRWVQNRHGWHYIEGRWR